MTQIFEELYLALCVPYNPDKVPKYLRDDPVRAYGQYTFEVGFKLGMQIASACLDPDTLNELH